MPNLFPSGLCVGLSLQLCNECLGQIIQISPSSWSRSFKAEHSIWKWQARVKNVSVRGVEGYKRAFSHPGLLFWWFRRLTQPLEALHLEDDIQLVFFHPQYAFRWVLQPVSSSVAQELDCPGHMKWLGCFFSCFRLQYKRIYIMYWRINVYIHIWWKERNAC